MDEQEKIEPLWKFMLVNKNISEERIRGNEDWQKTIAYAINSLYSRAPDEKTLDQIALLSQELTAANSDPTKNMKGVYIKILTAACNKDFGKDVEQNQTTAPPPPSMISRATSFISRHLSFHTLKAQATSLQTPSTLSPQDQKHTLKARATSLQTPSNTTIVIIPTTPKDQMRWLIAEIDAKINHETAARKITPESSAQAPNKWGQQHGLPNKLKELKSHLEVMDKHNENYTTQDLLNAITDHSFISMTRGVLRDVIVGLEQNKSTHSSPRPN